MIRHLLAVLVFLGAGGAGAVPLDGRLERAARVGHHLVMETSPAGPVVRARSLASGSSAAPGGLPGLPVLLLGTPDLPRLAALGVRVRSKGAGVVTADVPRDAVTRLSGVPGLTGARLAGPVVPHLDLAVAEMGVEALRLRVGDGWTGATGAGVIVGLVDSGLDVTHEDFRRADGSTRVLAHWGQADATGPPPPGFDRGTLRTAADIDLGLPVQADRDAHGTHVAGIAAGDGSATGNGEAAYRYPGIAPEADLVVVATELDEASVLDGARFVFEEAERQGMPVVLNLSLGTQVGPHDGTSPLDRGIAELLGPGRLAVASAGNEGNRSLHGEVVVPPGGSATAELAVLDVLGSFPFHAVWIDAFHERGESLAVTVITPGGQRLGPYGAGTSLPDTVTGEGTVFLSYTDYPAGTTREVQVVLSDYDPALGDGGTGQADRPAAGTWRIEIHDLGGTGGELDLWIPLVQGHAASWKPGTHDPTEEVSSPATAPGVIAVGCYNNRPCWPSLSEGESCSGHQPAEELDPGRLTWFSSRGPTRDGRRKPDVVAPGLAIVSARSADTSPGAAASLGLPRTSDPDGVHMVQAGTSQSAPVVTGLLALALGSRPDLAPAEAGAALTASARLDGQTGAVWNPHAGHGKVEAAGFLGIVPSATGQLTAVSDAGGVVLRFAANPGEGILGFLLRTGEGGTWRDLTRFPGPGPHVHRDPSGRPGSRYRLLAERRDGTLRRWAEATAPSTPGGDLRASPNPTAATTVIRLTAPAGPGGVRLLVHDVAGRLRRSLHVPPGGDAVSWSGHDDAGRPVAAGIYWIRRADGGGPALAVVRSTSL